jgi:hypothetical protein
MTTYRVHFTISYLDGTLAGLNIPSSVGFGTVSAATKWLGRIERLREAGEAVRATGTRSRYVYVSKPYIAREDA